MPTLRNGRTCLVSWKVRTKTTRYLTKAKKNRMNMSFFVITFVNRKKRSKTKRQVLSNNSFQNTTTHTFFNSNFRKWQLHVFLLVTIFPLLSTQHDYQWVWSEIGQFISTNAYLLHCLVIYNNQNCTLNDHPQCTSKMGVLLRICDSRKLPTAGTEVVCKSRKALGQKFNLILGSVLNKKTWLTTTV